MYGRFGYDYGYSDDSVTVGITPGKGFYCYSRTIAGGDSVQKRILSDAGRIIVNPVEPLNLPEEITNYLEIAFEPMIVEPFANKDVFLTFPVEIGIFVAAKKNIQVLDIFSLSPQKYSLYGPSSGGLITRWWHSEVFDAVPEVNHNILGIMQLTIENTTREWVELSRAVFEGYGMKIYYGGPVSMVARMKIMSPRLAETEFFDHSLVEGQKKALELYTARELHVVRRTCPMEWGMI
ncbi:MAG: DUF432 domain-containing protein [Methanomicrobiales archaeon]|nr:DUF432 domain-containing protein [Methanomicrobiales archaeon]